ncbi:MAG: hypothetical protein MR210_00800 [Erysipelotrichaceae bacterium]|nr:hypothetical protein [Erysipelotrichaceae bacterium]MDY5251621.1 hypothetical protein [Erysipelotrichaceae bacterium]
MKYGFLRKIINSPFPTTQCGHITQTNELFVYHDDLEARLLYLSDDNGTIIHLSADLLSIDRDTRIKLQNQARIFFQDEKLVLITSATHTHIGNNVRDERYIGYFIDLISNAFKDIIIHETKSIKTEYQIIKFNEVGKSRISNYESNNEYLSLIKLMVEDRVWLNIIIHNCHPTILHANVPYFSSEFPGYVMQQLRLEYPDEEFTYMSGASGDISSRFTRPNQTYAAVEFLGNKMIAKIKQLKANQSYTKNLELTYHEEEIKYKHDFTPVDISKIRGNLTARELETIEYGKIMRENLEKDPSKLVKEATIGCWNLGCIKLVFYPNEMFSQWLDEVDLKEKLLISYSNGFGPYIIPKDFAYITYESFNDTLTLDTKDKVLSAIKNI